MSIVSRDGNLVVGLGSDFESGTGLNGLTKYAWAGYGNANTALMNQSLAIPHTGDNKWSLFRLDAAIGNDQKVRVRTTFGGTSSHMAAYLYCRLSNAPSYDSGYRLMAVGGANQLRIYRVDAGVHTIIASTGQFYTGGDVVELEIEADGTTIYGRDLTNGLTISAVDATYSSGLAGIGVRGDDTVCPTAVDYMHVYDGTNSGTWTSPVVDSGNSNQGWLLAWAEQLGASCDVTVDFDANDNPSNLFTGSEVTGITDPDGSIPTPKGRYAQAKINLTRTSSAEAIVGSLAVLPTALSPASVGYGPGSYKDADSWKLGTLSDVVSRNGDLLVGLGSDFELNTGLDNVTEYTYSGNNTPVRSLGRRNLNVPCRWGANGMGFEIIDDSPASADYKVTIESLVGGETGMSGGALARFTDIGNFYWARILKGSGLQLYKLVGGSATLLGSDSSHAYDYGDRVIIELAVNGTSITATETINGPTVNVTDGSLSSAGNGGGMVRGDRLYNFGLENIHIYDGTNTGTWTSPVVDGGSDDLSWLLGWVESLGASCDITVDFDASNNAGSLFGGSEQTGITDPTGVVPTPTGRYAQAKVHFTRTSPAEAILNSIGFVPTSLGSGGGIVTPMETGLSVKGA